MNVRTMLGWQDSFDTISSYKGFFALGTRLSVGKFDASKNGENRIYTVKYTATGECGANTPACKPLGQGIADYMNNESVRVPMFEYGGQAYVATSKEKIPYEEPGVLWSELGQNVNTRLDPTSRQEPQPNGFRQWLSDDNNNAYIPGGPLWDSHTPPAVPNAIDVWTGPAILEVGVVDGVFAATEVQISEIIIDPVDGTPGSDRAG